MALGFLVCALQTVQRDKGGFVVVGVAAYGLAQLLRRRGDVQNVIDDLENQAKLCSVAHQRLAGVRVGAHTRSGTAQLDSGNDERTGFVGVQV